MELFGDRYQVQGNAGRDLIAVFYHARDLLLDRVVLVKVLRDIYRNNPRFVMCFEREAKMLSSLRHPNVVQVFDHGQSQGNCFIVMYEMLTGHTPFDRDTPVAVAMQHIQDAPTPPSQFNPNITPALEDIILRCLEKVPEMRYRDGLQMARVLEKLEDS